MQRGFLKLVRKILGKKEIIADDFGLNKKPKFFIKKTDGIFELRQTRFIGKPKNPNDVVAVARSLKEIKRMQKKFGLF